MTTAPTELRITGIAAGGDGVARHEGMVVFVPRTAPGDRVEAALQPRRRFATGRLRRVLAPSPDRVDPPCPHYERDQCGGCQLQHLRIEAQIAAKRQIIRDAMVRIGKRDVQLPEVRASPLAWRYRNKLTLAMRRRGGRWIAGLHPYDRPAEVFALTDCLITSLEVNGIWRAILAAADTLPDAQELRGAVRLDRGAASFVLEGGSSWSGATDLLSAVPALGAVWWIPAGGARRLMASRAPEAPGPAFGQVNPAMAALLRDYLLERIGALHAATVIDGYAGEGDLAVELERRGVGVTTIEMDLEAVARSRARLSTGATVLEGRVEDLLEPTLPADVIVLNPPRAGLHERIPGLLTTEASPHRAARARPAILYVSCDPATLARDVARLPNHRIASLTAFDMFPQTAHVETVCELLPR